MIDSEVLKEEISTVKKPLSVDISRYTDKYFVRTRAVVERFGDCRVTYAVFMRRQVLYAGRPAIMWLETVCRTRGVTVDVETPFTEGDLVGANEVMLHMTGSFAALVELETILLQKLGAACVAAYNAFAMASTLPQVAFWAMDARHCAGTEMAELMAYAAAVGSTAAKQRAGAVGFLANTNDATAYYFGQSVGRGTMPHALIGYAGSTIRAAEMFHATFPNDDLTVLIDYFGREITDSLAVAQCFPDLVAAGRLSVRMDTPQSRFIEGLDYERSCTVLRNHAPAVLYRDWVEDELHHLIGPGVSAAALWCLREALDNAGFSAVRLVASSGFSLQKCRLMAQAEVPLDVIGTGSYLPESWPETYATADIIAYDGQPCVKLGREHLLQSGGFLQQEMAPHDLASQRGQAPFPRSEPPEESP
ncbi:Nicotinate phosphoribosyltransferase [invertebrate metagenome]|uniref:Nicotinate phosphoribosyltransferase n=1 Tax=invertebrate metagenome TaxID=1711999 RepID=A0A484H580_9ZZZZ